MDDMTFLFKEETFLVFLGREYTDSVVFLRRATCDDHTWFEMKDNSYIKVQSEEVLDRLHEMYWKI